MGIKAGIYKAKIKDYGFNSPAEGKNPSVFVEFEFNEIVKQNDVEMEVPKKLSWFGSFNGGARDITVAALVETFGLKGSTVAEVAKGIGSGVLEEARTYEIDIQPNEYNGKVTDRIKYVNIEGAARRVEKLDVSSAAVFVGGLNLDGDVAALRAKIAARPKEDANPLPQQPKTEEVPF